MSTNNFNLHGQDSIQLDLKSISIWQDEIDSFANSIRRRLNAFASQQVSQPELHLQSQSGIGQHSDQESEPQSSRPSMLPDGNPSGKESSQSEDSADQRKRLEHIKNQLAQRIQQNSPAKSGSSSETKDQFAQQGDR